MDRSLSIYLSIHPSTIHRSISIYLSIYLSISLSISLSVSLFIYPSIFHPSIHPSSIYLSISLPSRCSRLRALWSSPRLRVRWPWDSPRRRRSRRSRLWPTPCEHSYFRLRASLTPQVELLLLAFWWHINRKSIAVGAKRTLQRGVFPPLWSAATRFP